MPYKIGGELLCQFCSYLLANQDRTIEIQGEPLQVSKWIEQKVESSVDLGPELRTLTVTHIVFGQPIDQSRFPHQVLLTNKGRTVHTIQPDEPLSRDYLALAECPYLGEIVTANRESIITLDPFYLRLESAVEDQVLAFDRRRLEQRQMRFIEEARKQEFYPYKEAPKDGVAAASQVIFDVVLERINDTANLERMPKRQQAVVFKLLKRALENEDLFAVLNEVATLSDQDVEKFREVLERTTLNSIIHLASEVTDRLVFLDMLHEVVYGKDLSKHIKERSQLHRILESKCWLFGPRFHLATSDQSFREIVKKHRQMAGLPKADPEDIAKIKGITDIPDLFLACTKDYPHAPKNNHLLVELKAPRVSIGPKEVQQAKKYANTVTNSAEFDTRSVAWDIFLVSARIQKEVETDRTQKDREIGLVSYAESMRLWVYDLILDDQLTFHDLGVSAFSGANLSGALGAFLSAVQTKLVSPGSYLLVENIDRVSRQGFWEALPTIQSVVNAGIVLVTLTDERRYDLAAVQNDPMAIMSLCFGLIRAGEESSLKARRVGEAWAAKRAKIGTTPMTARVPGWLVLDRPSCKIKLIPERAAIVRQIYKLTLKGLGQDSIAKQLNAKRVPTFGRAKHWQRSYIAKITSNPAVIGTFLPHVKRKQVDDGKRKPLDPVTGYYPPVVDKATFTRVQALLKSRTPLRGRHAANGVVRNLFSGLARCPKCGGTFTRVYKGSRGGAYLACALAKTGGGCKYHAVRYEPIEAAFLTEADRVLNEVPAGDPGVIDAALTEAEAAALYLEEQRDNLLDAIQTGGSSALVERLKAVENEVAELRRDHEELLIQQADAAGPLRARKVSDLHALLRRKPLDRAPANALLRQLFSGMVVDYISKARTLTLHWKHGGETVIVYGMESA